LLADIRERARSLSTQHERLDGEWKTYQVRIEGLLRNMRAKIDALETAMVRKTVPDLPKCSGTTLMQGSNGPEPRLNSAHEPDASATYRAQQVLDRYSDALRSLAIAASVFSKAFIQDHGKFQVAVKPLGDTINGVNDAYVKLSKQHLLLLIDSASKSSTLSEARAYCRISEVDKYQWDTWRPRINSLVNKIIYALRHSDPETLADIQRQQSTGWLELCSISIEGADRFSSVPKEHSRTICDGAVQLQ
jgi:hypothetical protein